MTEGSKNHFSLPDYFQQMSVVVATSTILLQDQTTLHLTDNKYIEGNTKKEITTWKKCYSISTATCRWQSSMTIGPQAKCSLKLWLKSFVMLTFLVVTTLLDWIKDFMWTVSALRTEQSTGRGNKRHQQVLKIINVS